MVTRRRGCGRRGINGKRAEMAQDQKGPTQVGTGVVPGWKAVDDSGVDPSREDGAPIVAFDFDGTLTVRDSFTAFLAWRAGPLRYALGAIKLVPAGASYMLHR